MGMLDDMKDKAKDAAEGASGLLDKAKDAAEGLMDKVPGGDKVKGILDKDGDGDIDALEKAKDLAGGLVDKAKGLLGKDGE